MPGNKNLIVSVFGRKGSGKTELTHKMLREYPRVIAFDTVAQYGEDRGFIVVHGREAGARALERIEHKAEFRIALRADETEDLLALMEVAYAFEDVLVVVDETPWYCTPQKLPRELSMLVRLGRHRRISQFYVAQRPSEIHRSITAQSDIIASFVQREQRDVQWLIDAGGGADAEHVAELDKYKLIAFGDGMEGSDVPLAILAQRQQFGGRDKSQVDMFE